MTVKISYLNKPITKTSANEILFVDEKFNISKIKKFISNTEFSYINDLLKTNDLKKKYYFLMLIQKKN
jgi:leucyl aminopeptidase